MAQPVIERNNERGRHPCLVRRNVLELPDGHIRRFRPFRSRPYRLIFQKKQGFSVLEHRPFAEKRQGHQLADLSDETVGGIDPLINDCRRPFLYRLGRRFPWIAARNTRSQKGNDGCFQ